MGHFTFEAYAGVWFFTDNKEFFGSQVRSQKPLYTLQLHGSYEFQNGIWLAASTRQSLGGEAKVGDGELFDPESNNRVGVSLAIPVGSRYFVKLMATTGLTATIGNDYDTLGVAWQVLF